MPYQRCTSASGAATMMVPPSDVLSPKAKIPVTRTDATPEAVATWMVSPTRTWFLSAKPWSTATSPAARGAWPATRVV